ncbi:MAG: YihY/virulence factor BrkB family protein [Nitrococcus mobilis]|nr:YihY/virulence factor BrkB family protein [Nitrococcus mobilis]
MLFSFYVGIFYKYANTYGPMGVIIILLLWFYLTTLVILFRAELNAEMEHQTMTDTTKGKS